MGPAKLNLLKLKVLTWFSDTGPPGAKPFEDLGLLDQSSRSILVESLGLMQQVGEDHSTAMLSLGDRRVRGQDLGSA